MTFTKVDKQLKLQVCLSPALITKYDLNDTIAIVIDVFRATTSICYGLANGADAIIPVASLEACLSYKAMGYLIAAERDGKVVEGFDFGNSPFSYTPESVANKTVVLTTTNGTKAIDLCKHADEVLVASFLNAEAVANYLRRQNKHILLICAGWKDHPGLEDVACAGKMVDLLFGFSTLLDDGAHIAHATYRQSLLEGLPLYLQKASHTQRMQGLDLDKDIQLCLQENIIHNVPFLYEDRLINKPEFKS